MKTVPIFRQFAVTIAVTFISFFASAAPVIIDGASMAGAAYSGSVYNSNFIGDRDYGARTLDLIAGVSSTSSTRNYQDTGSGAIFDFVFNHARAGDRNGQAWTNGYLQFRVGTDTSYELTGFYSSMGTAGVGLTASIHDYTAGSNLFFDQSISSNTLNESFVLGVANDADAINLASGSLSGTLLANHDYYFAFDSAIFQTAGLTDNGATANGCVTLRIGGATGGVQCGAQVGTGSVPEPGSVALLAVAMLAVGLVRRKKPTA